MASRERTAYPRFKGVIPERDLHELYTPTLDDLQFLKNATKLEPLLRLNIMLLLKTFQFLGYFPRLQHIPAVIVQHIRIAFKIPPEIAPDYESEKTLYRHHQAIRAHLNVQIFDAEAKQIAEQAIRQAAQTMDDPADLINVAIEVLIQQRYELPDFHQFERLVGHIRTQVNEDIFSLIAQRLTDEQRRSLDGLLIVDPEERQSPLNILKQGPWQPVHLAHARTTGSLQAA